MALDCKNRGAVRGFVMFQSLFLKLFQKKIMHPLTAPLSVDASALFSVK